MILKAQLEQQLAQFTTTKLTSLTVAQQLSLLTAVVQAEQLVADIAQNAIQQQSVDTAKALLDFEKSKTA